MRVHWLKKIAKQEIELEDRHNLIAILVKGGKILAVGQNDMSRTHPKYFNGEYDRCVHAEYDALRQVRSAEGTDLYVFRFKKNGDMGDSEPCEHCMDYIRSRGVGRLYFHKNGKQKKVVV